MDGVSVSNESLDDSHSFLDMELEALQSIYINEIEVEIDTKSTTVSIDLHPATADKLEEQYVRMTLQFMLDEGYPEDIPKVKIRNPRGLSEEKLNCVMKDLQSIAESKRGSSMLFEMIESAKEHLTAGNRPCGECAICLHGFSDKDIFTKTECYHYFHSNCLARYSKYFLQNSEENETDPHNKTKNNELLCPMCRIPIQFRGSEEDYPPPEASDESHFTLTDEIIDLQKRMTDLFQKQVEKGGIIDIEAEKNKYLIEISDVPTRVNNEERMDQKQLVESDMAAQKTDGSDQVDSPNKEKKYNRDQNQRTDYRGRNRNFNKQNDYRGNYRSGGRYNNKQSYGDFRGNQNRNKYDRYSAQRFDRNRGNSRKNSEDLQQVSESAHDSELQSSDTALSQDFAGSSAQCEDASEIPEHSMCDSKNKPNSSSPRYNRGYRRDNYSYNSRYGDRRSDRSNFQDDQNSHSSHKQSSVDNDAEDTCKSVDKELKERSSEYGEYKKQHYRSDRYRQDNYLPRERYSDSRNSHRGGAIDNEDEEVCKSEYKEPKEKSSEYGEHRKAPYRSDRYRQDNYITRERYSDRNSQRSGVFENEDGDKEKASEYHVRKQHYITDRYRQNNEYDSRDRYMDRNSQRGGRGGYTKRGNYDSHYSGKNRYMDADKDHYYADRDRNFRGRRMPRDDRYRGNNTRDGYRQKSSRNYAGNNFMKQTDENYHQTSTSENHEHADLSSRSQSSDSNHHSVDSGTLDNVSSSDRYSKSLLDKPEAQVEKDISDFDKKSSIKFSDKSADDESYIPPPTALNEKPLGSLRTALNPPPGFANPLKKVIYGLQGANPPPGFNRS